MAQKKGNYLSSQEFAGGALSSEVKLQGPKVNEGHLKYPQGERCQHGE